MDASDQAPVTTGHAILQPFLRDPTVARIFVDGTNPIYVERERNLLHDTTARFESESQLMALIQSMVASQGMQLGPDRPSAVFRMSTGHLVSVVVPPLTATGASLVIRKPPDAPEALADSVEAGMMSNQMSQFLGAILQAPLNIMIGGNTGSDRGAFLSTLMSVIPDNQRVIAVEPLAHLKVNRPKLLRLQSRPDVIGAGGISYSAVLRLTQQLRPDRIVASEVPDDSLMTAIRLAASGAALMATIHSTSPLDTLFRLEAALGESQPNARPLTVRRYIQSGVDVIIQLSRLADGVRRVTAITQFAGFDREELILEDLYVFKPAGMRDSHVMGSFEATGALPRFDYLLLAAGVELSPRLFRADLEFHPF